MKLSGNIGNMVGETNMNNIAHELYPGFNPDLGTLSHLNKCALLAALWLTLVKLANKICCPQKSA